jgi:uncharacterized protein (DUF1778 family)
MDFGRHSNARLSIRVPAELKTMIEAAAACLGQSVSGFAVSTLAQAARTVIEQGHVTRLSGRDREAFMAILDDADAQPNKALKAAAKRYGPRKNPSQERS